MHAAIWRPCATRRLPGSGGGRGDETHNAAIVARGDGHSQGAPPARRPRLGAGPARAAGRAGGSGLGDGAPLGPRHEPGVLGQHPGGVAGLGAASSSAAAAVQLGRRRPRGRWCGRRRRSRCGRRRRTKAMGPPSTASGATWPTQNPWVPPENRPSVTRAQSPPRPGALHGAGDGQHLAHARAALGALVADDDDRPGLDGAGQDGLHGRRPRRRRPGPVPSKLHAVEPGHLDHRPRRGPASRGGRRCPPSAWMGSASGWTTSPSGAGGSSAARFSATVRPVTVRQSPCSSPASSSSRITTGTPPMRSRSAMW